MIKKVEKILCIIIIIILLPILIVSGVILIDSFMHPDEVPSFFGWKPFIVLSDTMEPNINSGDLVIVKETDVSNIKKNDIIAFKENDIVITHRINDIKYDKNEKIYITKGDNNDIEDKGYITENQIEGIYKFNIGRIGNFAIFIQTPLGMLIALSIPAILFLIIKMSETINTKKNIKEDEEIKEKAEEENVQLKEEIKK